MDTVNRNEYPRYFYILEYTFDKLEGAWIRHAWINSRSTWETATFATLESVRDYAESFKSPSMRIRIILVQETLDFYVE